MSTHPSADQTPHRVLVVSADMGAGHNATAAALEEQVRARWPNSTLRRVDALDLMGVGPLFRSIYVGNVEHTPWLYEFFYSSLWRHRWFAHASKRFTGSWCGRRLVAVLEEFEPDLVLSTYPLGSSGLAWLRRHRGLGLPVGAWVSDFSPHPFWVYPDLDLNAVLHETALVSAHAAEPTARVVVVPPPVVGVFHPPDITAEPAGGRRLRILVSCGSYSFGNTTELVRRLVAASTRAQVVAVTGRDENAFRRLRALGLPADRLRVLGWVDDMPTLLRTTDLVVTNAGGATALESLASGVPVLMYDPIAAHGRANADLMVVSGLAEIVREPARLVDYVRAIERDQSTLGALRQRIRTHLDRSDLADPLQLLTTAPVHPVSTTRRPPTWRLRPSDRLFAAVGAGGVRQEVGVVVELVGPAGPGLAAVRAQLAERVRWLPAMRRRLVATRGWRQQSEIEIEQHVREVVLEPHAGDGRSRWDRALAAVGDLWSEPLPKDRPAWQVRLIRLAEGPVDGGEQNEQVGALVAFKMHHAVADGISALSLLDALLSAPPGQAADGPATNGSAAALPRPPGGLRRTLSGLVSLASQGPAARQPLSRDPGPGHQVVTWRTDLTEVRALAHAYGARTSELVLTLLVQAFSDLLLPLGLLRPDRPLRTMVPIALRPARLDRFAGNWTGALAANLPAGPMNFSRRLELVRDELVRRAARGEAHAAQLVIRLAGRLPGPCFTRAAQWAYSSRFFHTVISYMPRPAQPRWLAGARVGGLYPILPLAPGVPLTAGAVAFAEHLCLGVSLDPGLGIGANQVRDVLGTAWSTAQRSPATVP